MSAGTGGPVPWSEVKVLVERRLRIDWSQMPHADIEDAVSVAGIWFWERWSPKYGHRFVEDPALWLRWSVTHAVKYVNRRVLGPRHVELTNWRAGTAEMWKARGHGAPGSEDPMAELPEVLQSVEEPSVLEAQVRALVDHLPPAQRRAVFSRYFDSDRSYGEAAAESGSTRQAVQQAERRALKALHRRMSP